MHPQLRSYRLAGILDGRKAALGLAVNVDDSRAGNDESFSHRMAEEISTTNFDHTAEEQPDDRDTDQHPHADVINADLLDFLSR